MRQSKSQFLLVCIFLLWFGGIAEFSSRGDEPPTGKTLAWHTELNKAVAESQQSGKPILMEINGRPWCPPCNTQGDKIITHKDFQTWASGKFVLLDIKVGQGYDKHKGNPAWRELMKKYRLPGIPATVMIEPDGETMGIVFPKDNIQQWIGAATNIITTHALRANAKAQEKSQSEHVIPFRLTKWNNISIPATLNESIALNLMFHTAVDSVSLTEATTQRFPEITFAREVETTTWGGRSKARVGAGYVLAIAGLPPQDVTLYEDLHSGHDTDGKLGPKQLASKLLAIDIDRSEIRTPTELPDNISEWQKLSFETERGMMFVKAAVHSASELATHKFMLHSGYSGFALLDDAFAAQHPFLRKLDIIAQSELTDSSGSKLVTKRIRLPKFSVAETAFNNVPVAFFSGAIGQQKYSVLGGDFLKRFNLIFDFESNSLYMSPSGLSAAEFFHAD